MIDIEKAKLNPSSVFKSPKQVLDDLTLSREDKIEILKQWSYDERDLSVAEEENMPALKDEKYVLDEIQKALSDLGAEHDHDHSGATKHG